MVYLTQILLFFLFFLLVLTINYRKYKKKKEIIFICASVYGGQQFCILNTSKQINIILLHSRSLKIIFKNSFLRMQQTEYFLILFIFFLLISGIKKKNLHSVNPLVVNALKNQNYAPANGYWPAKKAKIIIITIITLQHIASHQRNRPACHSSMHLETTIQRSSFQFKF